jgi:pyridoxamine 5'-phosphate oxidase
MSDVASRRSEYESAGLDAADVDADPLRQWQRWYDEAVAAGVTEPNAMALSTLGEDGVPDVRFVLVRGADERGFAFYTNLESRKGRELLEGASPNGTPAALCFWWPPLAKQVRVEGRATRVSDADADAYWSTRARESQVAAWASPQSAELSLGRDELLARFAELSRSLPSPVPRPPHWSGFRIEPKRIEFWEGRPHRLHHRVLYTREGRGWVTKTLGP